MPVMVQPAGNDSTVTVTVVAIRCGVNPALTSSLASVMEKQAAWAAAISSYGLVPFASPALVPKYLLCGRAPLPVVTKPLPPLRPPTQVAEALGFMETVSPDEDGANTLEDKDPPFRSQSRKTHTRDPAPSRTDFSGRLIGLQPSCVHRDCANTLFLGSA